MKVQLVYYKPSGKYYSDAEYFTGETDLWMIWNEVEDKLIEGKLPGLVDGAREFIVSVYVPEHPYNHPHLIIKPALYR